MLHQDIERSINMLINRTKPRFSEKREEILFSLRYSSEDHIAGPYHFPKKYLRKTEWVNKNEVEKN